jgi:hypothetical protein
MQMEALERLTALEAKMASLVAAQEKQPSAPGTPTRSQKRVALSMVSAVDIDPVRGEDLNGILGRLVSPDFLSTTPPLCCKLWKGTLYDRQPAWM